jgi:hypothetical protein
MRGGDAALYSGVTSVGCEPILYSGEACSVASNGQSSRLEHDDETDIIFWLLTSNTLPIAKRQLGCRSDLRECCAGSVLQ